MHMEQHGLCVARSESYGCTFMPGTLACARCGTELTCASCLVAVYAGGTARLFCKACMRGACDDPARCEEWLRRPVAYLLGPCSLWQTVPPAWLVDGQDY
jgi:hypothetical protein